MKPKRAPRIDLNPSSADRWTTCTASPQFIFDNWDKLPPQDTEYNLEGTTAHEVAAAMLEDRAPREKNNDVCPVPVDGEIRWHGWNYAEYVRGLMGLKATLTVEKKFPLWYMPARNAMIDALVVNYIDCGEGISVTDLENIHIVDYKYGAGIVVSPEENLQASIYARAVIEQKWAEETREWAEETREDLPVFIHIYQPRGRAAEDGAAHVWETTWGEIKKFTKNTTNAAEAIQWASKNQGHTLTVGLIDFTPSDKACQWCPAKGFCPARQQAFIDEGIKDFSVITEAPKHLPPVKAVTVTQLVAMVKHGAAIKKWIDDAEEYAHGFMLGGGKLPGLKLVLSRQGNRKWSDPKKAAALLLESHLKKSEVIEETTISPAEAEKLLGKHKFGVELTSLIDRSPAKPVIARADDPREEYGAALANDFEDLTNLEEE